MDLESRKNTHVNALVSFKRILDRGIHDEDLHEEEEERLFIKTAKADMQLKRIKQKERQKKEEIERKMVKRTQKQNVQLIENFEKSEVRFITNYLLSSNTAIFNGDKLRASDFKPG